ncbi:MAG: O-antigen ligase family protein [Planctomycetes bacterium]|nr:O-antigen ligase family protein [Planctomycetota bacterium]
MLSPFVILILFLPLSATASLVDPELLRWTATATIALLALALAGRDGKLEVLARPRRLVLLLGLGLGLPLFWSLAAPADPTTVLLECARWLSVVLVALAAAVSLGPLAARRLAPLQAAVPALLLLADRLIRGGLWPAEVAVHPREITATMGNSALVGECAMISLPFLFLALAGRSRAIALALLLGLGAPLAWLLIGADSRGAWLGAAAIVFAFVLLRRRRLRTEPSGPERRLLALLALGLLVAAVVLQQGLGGPRLLDRLRSIVDVEHPTNVVRLELWRDAAAMGRDHLLTGVGPGRFGAEHGAYRGAREWRISGLGTRAGNPHDEYLRLFAETGLPGLLLAALGLFFVLRGLWRRTTRVGPAGDAAIASLAAWAGFLAMALTWGSLGHPATLVPLAVFSALALRDRQAGKAAAQPRFAWLLLVPGVLALGLLLGQLERESNAVQLRDRAESLTRSLNEAADPARAPAQLLDLGETGRALVRVAGSPFVSVDLRYRLLLSAENLAEQRGRLVPAASADADPSATSDLAGLQNAARRLPEPNAVRELALRQIELAPAHLASRRLLARVDLMAGRKPEAITGLEQVLTINPAEPEARLELAALFRGSGSDHYGRAAEILEGQVSLYPDLQPAADEAWAQLALCLGGQRKLDQALAAVDRWVAHCGDDDARRMVAGELVLHFGETDETLGRFLADAPVWAERQQRGDDCLSRLSDRPETERYAGYLAHLGRHHHDTPVIVALGDLLASASPGTSPGEHLEGIKNRAFALGRCHFAWEGLLGGHSGPLRVHLRLARTRNPRSGDPYLIELIANARDGRVEAAIGALKDLLERGFRPRSLLGTRPELADFLARPEVRALLTAD